MFMRQGYHSSQSFVKLEFEVGQAVNACCFGAYARFRGTDGGAGVGVREKLSHRDPRTFEVGELPSSSRPHRTPFLPRARERSKTVIICPEHERLNIESNMMLQYLRQLYSLDTLDTRFVVPATIPPKEALELAELDPAQPLPVRNGQVKGRDSAEAVQPSRWDTPEFYFYYLVILICVPLMCKAVVDVSNG